MSKEFYLLQEIPNHWDKKIKEEIIKHLKTKLPANAVTRYEGYMSMGSNDFAIIYTVEE